MLSGLQNWAGKAQYGAEWEHGARKMKMRATGVKAIIGGVLRELFAASTLEVYKCSICGKVFPLPEHGRRPREGRRRFCTDNCRNLGKLDSNRESYRRLADKPKN